jgi:hypothetical protein
MYAPSDAEDEIDRELGFVSDDPWPSEAVRTWRPSSPSQANRALVWTAIVVGGSVALLGVIQLFSIWFGPCFRGAC